MNGRLNLEVIGPATNALADPAEDRDASVTDRDGCEGVPFRMSRRGVREEETPALPASGFGKRLAFEGVATICVRIMGIGTAVAADVAISRTLTPADAGVFFLLVTIVSFSAMVASFGLTAAMTRFLSEGIGRNDPTAARQSILLGSRIAAVSMPLTAAAMATVLYLAGRGLFNIPVSGALAILLATCVLTLSVLQLAANILRSFHRSGLATLLTGQSGGPAVNLLFLISLFFFGFVGRPNVVAAAALNAGALCCIAPIAVASVARIATKQLNVAVLPIGSYAAPTLGLFLTTCLSICLSQICSYCTGFGDMCIAGSLVPHDQLALYAAARRMMLVVGLPLQFVNLVVVASIAELKAREKIADLERILRTFAGLAGVPSLAALAVLLIFPGFLSGLVFGPFYAQSAGVLSILCLGQLVFVCAGSAELTLTMTGHQRAALVINATTATLLFAAGIPVTWRFGIVGLAVVNASVISVQVIAFSVCVRRRLGIWTLVDPVALLNVRTRLSTSLGADVARNQ
jgi:O-antigen/teichoic acid export membrane protein